MTQDWRKRCPRDAGNRCVVIVDAIEKKVIVAIALSIDGKATVVVGRSDGTGGEQDELVGIAEDERKIRNLFGINYVGEFEAIAFNGSDGRTLNINRYRRGADSEVKVQRKIGGDI